VPNGQFRAIQLPAGASASDYRRAMQIIVAPNMTRLPFDCVYDQSRHPQTFMRLAPEMMMWPLPQDPICIRWHNAAAWYPKSDDFNWGNTYGRQINPSPMLTFMETPNCYTPITGDGPGCFHKALNKSCCMACSGM
jgi:hypothetical protein